MLKLAVCCVTTPQDGVLAIPFHPSPCGSRCHGSIQSPLLGDYRWSFFWGCFFQARKGTQTQTFWSGYLRVGRGSSAWTGGGQRVRYVLRSPGKVGKPKVRYVLRNPRKVGKPNFWAGYPGILPGYRGMARKVWETKCVQFLVPLRAQRLKNVLRSPSGIEIFNRDWKFQSRPPANPYFCGEFWRLGLKFSILKIEIFKRDWKNSIEIEFFQSLGP